MEIITWLKIFSVLLFDCDWQSLLLCLPQSHGTQALGTERVSCYLRRYLRLSVFCVAVKSTSRSELFTSMNSLYPPRYCKIQSLIARKFKKDRLGMRTFSVFH